MKIAHAQCSMAKLYCSEMADRVADRAVQVFGGRGYMRENVAERFFRELRVERIWEGTSEIQRMIIAGQLTSRGVRPWPEAPREGPAVTAGRRRRTRRDPRTSAAAGLSRRRRPSPRAAATR